MKEAKRCLEDKSYAYAAFFAEQCAQKALKAFLIFQGRRHIIIHSVGELAKEAATVEESFQELIESGKKLDRHYISARYPDALPEPAIPAESYAEDEGSGAVAMARAILEASRRLVALR